MKQKQIEKAINEEFGKIQREMKKMGNELNKILRANERQRTAKKL